MANRYSNGTSSRPPQDNTPRAPRSKPKQGVSSRSPSLTPPPPSVAQRSRSNPLSPAISPGLGKRKRSTSNDRSELGNGAEAGPSEQNGFTNGESHRDLEAEVETQKDQPLEEAEEQELLMPENIQGPDAEQAFLEAMDAFDEQDFGVPDAVQEEPVEVNNDPEMDESQVFPVDGQADTEMEDKELPVGAGAEQNEAKEQSPAVEGLEANGEVISGEAPNAEEIAGKCEHFVKRAIVIFADSLGPSTEVEENTEVDIPEIVEEPATQVEEPLEEPQAAPTAPAPIHHSSHAPPPSQAAMREMLKLELKFAALRDRLYIERMEEAAEEEEMILNGEHHLYSIHGSS